MEGLYSFRFGGISMIREGVPHHIVGVGLLKLFPDGTLIGRQTSSITRLQPPDPRLLRALFRLRGTYKISSTDMGEAWIEFTSVFPKQVLEGSFSVTPTGPDTYWIISTGATVTSSADQYANEVVAGEIVRVGPLPRGALTKPWRWGEQTDLEALIALRQAAQAETHARIELALSLRQA